MKYIEDYKKEAKEIITRFEESKELIKCVGAESTIERLIGDEVLDRYNEAIESVKKINDFLTEISMCENNFCLALVLLRTKL